MSPSCVNMRARMVSLGMRRLPITRICAIVSAVCAKDRRALESRTGNARASSNAMRANRCVVRIAWEMEVCLIFTGFDPCGRHKFSFVLVVGFTGRICTPSLLKIWPYIKER